MKYQLIRLASELHIIRLHSLCENVYIAALDWLQTISAVMWSLQPV
jgi:hypothetical protein